MFVFILKLASGDRAENGAPALWLIVMSCRSPSLHAFSFPLKSFPQPLLVAPLSQRRPALKVQVGASLSGLPHFRDAVRRGEAMSEAREGRPESTAVSKVKLRPVHTSFPRKMALVSVGASTRPVWARIPYVFACTARASNLDKCKTWTSTRVRQEIEGVHPQKGHFVHSLCILSVHSDLFVDGFLRFLDEVAYLSGFSIRQGLMLDSYYCQWDLMFSGFTLVLMRAYLLTGVTFVS